MMFNAFRERRPWAASVIALVLDPFTAMLYLGRGWSAVAYFFAEAASAIGFLALVGPSLLVSPESKIYLGTLGVRLVGAAHSYYAARFYDAKLSKWYSRWYSIAAILIFLLLSAYA